MYLTAPLDGLLSRFTVLYKFTYYYYQEIVNVKWLKVVVKLKLTDQYHQQWGSNICNSDECTTYRIIKYDFKMEKYLLVLPPNLSRPLCKCRTCNHRLPIQQGRYSGIDRRERFCTLCDCNDIGDEFHYFFKCPFFNKLDRGLFLDIIL